MTRWINGGNVNVNGNAFLNNCYFQIKRYPENWVHFEADIEYVEYRVEKLLKNIVINLYLEYVVVGDKFMSSLLYLGNGSVVNYYLLVVDINIWCFSIFEDS